MEVRVTQGLVELDGADIYYERRGQGPALLLIGGGWGVAGALATVADMLAADFTVLTYDRRGNPRSPVRGPRRQFDVLRQAADAAAVINANGFTSAAVFGSSSGALILLELVAAYPDVVSHAVAHEPPIITALPDRGEFLDWYDHLYSISLQGQIPQAIAEFLARCQGRRDAGETGAPAAATTPGHRRNLERFMLEEMPVFTYYRPDYARLRDSDTPLTFASGRKCLNLHGPGQPVFYARATLRMAESTGKELVEFPGGHVSYMESPQAFVDALRSVLIPNAETVG